MRGFFEAQPPSKPLSKPKAKSAKVYDCTLCGLSNADIHSPKIALFGEGRRKILLWGEGPGEEEDKAGRPFCGPSGELLRKTLALAGVNMDLDCWLVNSVDCHIPGNKKPTLVQLRCCWERKRKALGELKPSVILLIGDYAVDSFYRCDPERSWMDLTVMSLRGKAVPDYAASAWICHTYHPAFILRGNDDKRHVFERDVALVARFKSAPKIGGKSVRREVVTDFIQARSVIARLHGEKGWGGIPIVIDYETSSYRYHEKIHKVYTVGLQVLDEDVVYVIPLEKTDLETGGPYWDAEQLGVLKLTLRAMMADARVPKVAQHLTHEHLCTKFFLGVDTENWWWDTKMGNRVQDEAPKVNGLKEQSYLRLGIPNYGLPDSVISADPKQLNKMDAEPLERVAEYNAKDVENTARLCKLQRKEVEAKGLSRAYELLHRGAESFAHMQQEGIRLDMALLHKYKGEWGAEFARLREAVLASEEGRKFAQLKGRPVEYKKQISRDDLTTLLTEVVGVPRSAVMDEAYLSGLADKCEFLSHELKARKVLKRLGVLENWDSLQVDGYLYPAFNLDIARSYRSTSTEPNFQNVPKRDEEGALIRMLVIPREGYVILEVDYSGMEVRILACWSRDPTLIDFILSGYDMHGHWATKIYGVTEGQVDKALWKRLRYGGKNGFVFPNFYGSYWKNTARNLWEYMPEDWKKDWPQWERWERHVRGCDGAFWDMFKGVRQRQEEAVTQYKRLGYIEMIGWGFRRHGYLNRNTIFNSHIQGPAYHCLMDAINHLVPLKRKESWVTKMPGQIHDAIFFDAHRNEQARVMEAVTEEMTVGVRRRNRWVIVPLEVEWERGEKNWLEMEKVKA